MQKISSNFLFRLLVILLGCIGSGLVLSILVFILSTQPGPNFDKVNCLYHSALSPPSLAITDNGSVLIKDFTDVSHDDFRIMERWKIADQTTAWKNRETGKIVLDADFFASAARSHISTLSKNESQVAVVAEIKNTNLTAEQFQQLVILLVESGVVVTSTHGWNTEFCLQSESNMSTTYQAEFSSMARIYTNTEAIERYDFSLAINKNSGEVKTTTTDRGALIKDNIELFGWSRYRSSEF